MGAGYKEYQQLNLPLIASEILHKWETEDTFSQSVQLREGCPLFVFYEGPPSANGLPGIHHVISRTLKDLVCRYKTMQQYQVKRKGGWDTHGLPVELGVEKLLGITKEDIGRKISVEDYNATCRREVLKYKDLWDELTLKMGYWVDLKDPYITFENNYIESLWWCLKELYSKNLLYEDVSIQPYSPAAGTGLSSHELNQPGTYKDVKDTSAVVMFKLDEQLVNKKIRDKAIGGRLSGDEIFIMAWTTTPWTLPSNLGLTVGEKIDYVLVATFNPYTHLPINVILAKALMNKYFKEDGQRDDLGEYSAESKILLWRIAGEFKGSELEGCTYEQLLRFESNEIKVINETIPGANPFRVITGDFVTTEEGTGIVHTAPAFGADDFKVGKKNNLGILVLVDREGKFVSGVGEFSGRYVKDYKSDPEFVDVNVDICVKLKKENRAFKIERYEHTYPHCWRTDKPIIYYPLDAWFIRTTAVKDRMIELNNTINWKPTSTGTGRFGNWLENMVDWNLSRSRYWGTALPIWRTEDGSVEKCIGSISELNEEIIKANSLLGPDVNKHYLHEGILDLHKPYVDEIWLTTEDGRPMKRVPDLIDVWFDSGAMPYAQWHYPFENPEHFKKNFPADFIAEGVDQTRGWFYTLHALGVLLFDSVAYKTVVSNGLVLDKNGNKMSKRLGNVIDPFETLDIFGPDATRWYLITNASPWDSLKFDIEGIREVQKKFFGTLYNTYQFFALYANVDGFVYDQIVIPINERPEMDRWIISSLNILVGIVENSMNDYEPTVAGRAIEDFVDQQLSNWYVRLSRRRYWKPLSGALKEHDKISAYQTLYDCLDTLSRLIAPIAPFFADWLFNSLNTVTKKTPQNSVHLLNFPRPESLLIDQELQEKMQLAQDVSSLVLSLRKKVNIKVRQPLKEALIPGDDQSYVDRIRAIEAIVMAETNIKGIKILEAGNNVIIKKARANFKTLGKRLGKNMKWAAQQIQTFNNEQIQQVLEGRYLMNPGNESQSEGIYLEPEDLEIYTDEIPGYEIASKGNLTIALDITIDEGLKMEGIAREFINKMQQARKSIGLMVTDRIVVILPENEGILPAIREYNSYICAEILADKLEFIPETSQGLSIEINDIIFNVNILKQED